MANHTGKGTIKPGEVRNPKGRPPSGDSLAEMVRMIGDEFQDRKTKKSRMELVIRKAWEQAERGDDKARQFLADRGWGKVPQSVELDWREKAKEKGIDPDKLLAVAQAAVAAVGDGSGDAGSMESA
jgi:hypothetical protein